jgi:hypothetical protein
MDDNLHGLRRENFIIRALHAPPVERIPGSRLPDPKTETITIRLGVEYLPPRNQAGD